jgi:hypothetical protein
VSPFQASFERLAKVAVTGSDNRFNAETSRSLVFWSFNVPGTTEGGDGFEEAKAR